MMYLSVCLIPLGLIVLDGKYGCVVVVKTTASAPCDTTSIGIFCKWHLASFKIDSDMPEKQAGFVLTDFLMPRIASLM